VSERAIANASPLILLARSGHFDLLRAAGKRVLVPAPVISEIERRGEADVTVLALRQADWIEVVPAPPIPPAIAAWNLGPGESAVLAHAASHPGIVAILDDRPARRCAELLSIPVRGTLAVVVAARRNGAISHIRPVVEALRKAGMYISQHIVDEVLAVVGE
jgi:predicted nucleic acid-binding protein